MIFISFRTKSSMHYSRGSNMGEIYPQGGIWGFQGLNCVHIMLRGPEAIIDFGLSGLSIWLGLYM